ncbi:RES family NAD+ phosphorylase [Paraburkholderia tropica]|uniref:RES family NAD+ phosphorylase n=1 Tax=Paraburkholderia tropica TaxID=92647 RepID=UPI0018D3D1D8|nr:RES family NAD+ phosphorylase [Paraburkholderia tropica]
MAVNFSTKKHFVCIDCCTAPLLRQLAASSGIRAICGLCGSNDATCADTGTDDFLLVIKALIRYHFGEWQYHSKLGDGSLESLFFHDPNPIIRISPKQDPGDREDVVLSFLNDVNTRQMQIEIFTAYGRAIYNHRPKTPISAGESAVLAMARKALTERNHFLVEAEYVNVLRPVVPYVASVVAAGTRWHRARLGAKERAANFREIGGPPSYFYQPHQDKTLGAPPVGATTAGRLNRPGVSYLYLASDAATAAAEIRPHPGELVSLGCFILADDRRIADLRSHDLTKLWRSDQELDMLELVIAMENAFATAAPPSNRSAYTVTQFLGELFRQLGFDGVRFRSTVGDGDNLVLFDPASAAWEDGSSRVIDVKRVRYELIDREKFDQNEQYDIDFDEYPN